MILTHVTMACDNAADFEQLKALSGGVVGSVRAEPGCLACDFAVDIDAPLTLHAIARYRDQAALSAHILAPATQAYMKGVGAIAKVTTGGSKYEVVSEAPLISGAANEAFERLTTQSG